VNQKKMAVQAELSKLGLTDLPKEDFDPSRVPTVEKAKLQTANAEAKFNRAKQLFEQKPPLISEQDFADLQTAYAVARSNSDVELLTARSLLAEARAKQSDLELESQRLRDATVRAPILNDVSAATQSASPALAATPRYAVATRLVSVGEYVREGTPLFKLVADNPIKYRAQVPERFLGQIKVDQPVKVSVEAFETPFAGKVARISPQVDTTSRTFAVETLVPNDDGRLQPGSFARGSIATFTQPKVTFVPQSAVVTFAGVSKVFGVKDDKAVEYKVELGDRAGDDVEIVSGFAGAVPLVIDGASKLAGGLPVIVSQSPTTQAAK
jgi:membrane fusion protein (multidrug efflux system)